VSSVISRSVWVLSQSIIKGSFICNVIALNILLVKIASFAVCDRANNSASVLDVVTVPAYLLSMRSVLQIAS